jgi:hypothetical protein
MSKRPSQGSPTSQRSFKKQKVSPPSPPPTMSTLLTKDQHAPVLSGISISSATPAFGPTAPNSFGKFGQPSSSSRLGFLEGNPTDESKGWTKVEKRKDKKKRKEEKRTLVRFYLFRSWRLTFNASCRPTVTARKLCIQLGGSEEA